MIPHSTGVTLLLLVYPSYMLNVATDVILMSFECDHCGYRDNELQDAAPLQDHGIRIVANILSVQVGFHLYMVEFCIISLIHSIFIMYMRSRASTTKW